MKRIACLIFVIFFGFGIASFSWAQAESNKTATEEKKAVDAGNKICPVSGEKIDEKTKVTYEYEGKIYNFCCDMCIPTFKKDPQNYIKKVEEELKSESKKEIKAEPVAPENAHEGHMH